MEKEQPVVAQAQAITAETNPDVDSDRYNSQIKVSSFSSMVLSISHYFLLYLHFLRRRKWINIHTRMRLRDRVKRFVFVCV